MQTEADDILRETLHGFEHGAIKEGALAAFNIALEQFHNAVADRRALLISLPQNLQRAGAQFRATGTLVRTALAVIPRTVKNLPALSGLFVTLFTDQGGFS